MLRAISFTPTEYATEANFVDNTTQTGAPIDTPKTIKFGPASTSANGIISVDADGVFTVLKRGPILAKVRLRPGRTGSAQTSSLFFWTELSLDAGVNWALTGNAVTVALSNADDTRLFFDISPLSLPVGTLIRQRFARSSTGNDSGDLIPSTPSVALQALGVPSSPSAQTTIYRVTNATYV